MRAEGEPGREERKGCRNEDRKGRYKGKSKKEKNRDEQRQKRKKSNKRLVQKRVSGRRGKK